MYVPEQDYSEFFDLALPDSVEAVDTRIWSDGYWLDATLYRPKDLIDTPDSPGIVMTHGWGGGKNSVAQYAIPFAAHGFPALTFSHDGWYGSSGRFQLLDDDMEVDGEGEGLSRVRMVRELIDPDHWIRNFRAATDYLATEPGVNANRLAAWGTSFGGGTALYCASTDDRFRALVAQVAFMAGPNERTVSHARMRSGEIARGKIEPFPTKADATPGLRGSLNMARMQFYDPTGAIHLLGAPTLIIDAENEELFDRNQSGGRVHELLTERGDIEVRYDVLPGIDHYGIYTNGFQHTRDAALEWFERHL